MAKAKLVNNKKAWILLLIIITFMAGFLVARARYKPQIAETRVMVEQKASEVDALKEQILDLQEKIELSDVEF